MGKLVEFSGNSTRTKVHRPTQAAGDVRLPRTGADPGGDHHAGADERQRVRDIAEAEIADDHRPQQQVQVNGCTTAAGLSCNALIMA